jgi:putative endonuclease
VLYTGVTNDIVRRAYEHRKNLRGAFTRRYNVHHVVYVETFDDIRDAIDWEKRIKKWNRAWKIRLIEKVNPKWTDLYEHL